MKKRLLWSTVLLLVVSCDKKKDQKGRTEYFTKASLEYVLQSENKEDSLFFNHWFKVADICYNLEELEIYKNISERIVSYAQQVKDTSSLAKGYEYIGAYYLNNHINDSAYLYYLKAEKYYSLAQDKVNIGKMLLSRASILYYDGNLLQAEISCLQALRIFNNLKNRDEDKRDIYDAYNLLGVVANDQQEYYKATHYYNKSLEMLTQYSNMTDNELLKSVTLNNLGVACRNKNENKEALSYFAQALEVKDLHERLPHLYAMLLDNTAYSRFKLKDNTGVQDLFYKALRIRERLNIPSGIVMSKLHMSEYYQEQKDTKKAFIFADEAYKTAKTKGTDPRNVMLTLRQLQAVDAPLKEAYAIAYNHIADSLYQAQSKMHDTITRELAEAEAKEKAKAKKKEKLKTVLIELGVILCFLGVHYIMYRRDKKEEEKQAKIYADLQEQEVQTLAILREQERYLKVCDLLLKRKKEEDSHTHFTGLLCTLYNQQRKERKDIALTDYTDVNWDTAKVPPRVKIHVYTTVQDCFAMINQSEGITLMEFEMYEDEENKVIFLNIKCNGIIQEKNSMMQEIAFNIKKKGGRFETINQDQGENTELKIVIPIKLLKPILL